MSTATETPAKGGKKTKTSTRKQAPPRPGKTAAADKPEAAPKKNGASTDYFKGIKTVGELSRGRTTFKVDPDNAIIVGIDTAHPEHHLLDVSWRHDTGIEELAYTMAKFQQVDAIVVNKDGGRYLVVEGRRRVLAGRLIKKWIKEKDERACGLKAFMLRAEQETGDEQDLAVHMVLANQRLDDTPMEKARKCQMLRRISETSDEGDALTDKDLAAIFAVTPQAIAQWNKAVNLAATIVAAVDGGKLAFSAALQLADLPKDEQTEAFNKLLAEAREQAVAEGRNPDEVRVNARSTRQAGKKQESTRPGLRDIRKVAECPKVEDNVRMFARWVLGEVGGQRIKGVIFAITHEEEEEEEEEEEDEEDED